MWWSLLNMNAQLENDGNSSKRETHNRQMCVSVSIRVLVMRAMEWARRSCVGVPLLLMHKLALAWSTLLFFRARQVSKCNWCRQWHRCHTQTPIQAAKIFYPLGCCRCLPCAFELLPQLKLDVCHAPSGARFLSYPATSRAHSSHLSLSPASLLSRPARFAFAFSLPTHPLISAPLSLFLLSSASAEFWQPCSY